ncbi:MAG: regulatory iron-sulfur-containing complex subunit RicT [Thermoguttaceae bacterium]|nr:regulatory iron-sulfur-containing complex subunit RicT [Thermoguttaceae bacterium]
MKRYIARYGAMRLLGIFAHSAEDSNLFHGTKVIVRTSRGLETAIVLCEATAEAIAELPPEMEENRLIRIMTLTDENESRKIREGERDDFFRCQAIVKRMKIGMDLVRVEHIFGGERLIVYYVAEGRIDFRELVRVLASEFQTRIEMKQIGVRDETKLVADVGDCGREVCCNSYLIAMPPVSMKMAKLQKATLDPTKISGRCGRLKCCLRYEYDVYREIVSILPPVGKLVSTPDGNGRVISQELLAKKVVVELLADHTRKTFDGVDVALLPMRSTDDGEKRTNDRFRRDRTQSDRTCNRNSDKESDDEPASDPDNDPDDSPIS